MATTGNERYLRYLLLTGEGGTLILRSILDRETDKSRETLDELLKTNKGLFEIKCKADDEQLKKIFPPVGNRDICTWDISLLAKVILRLFRKSLAEDEILRKKEISNISLLRELRNSLSHSASFSKDEDEYDDDRRRMASLLTELSNGLDGPVQAKCQNLIQSCNIGPIDINGATERVKEISRYDEIFSEHLKTLTENVIDISRKVDTVLLGMEDLKLMVRDMVQQNVGVHSFYVLGTKMTLKGPDARQTILGEEAIVRVFRTALKRTGGDRDISKLTEAVMNILDDIENCNNVEVNDIEPLCIKISMKCRTLRGILELLEYLQGDVFKKKLVGLVLALEEMYNCLFRITFEIERDSLNDILYSLENRKSVPSRPETLGEDEYSDVQSSKNSHHQTFDDAKSTETTFDDDETKLQKENEYLFDKIVDSCECIDDEDPNHIILLIGRIGAGKSSLINTLHKVLTGRYFIIANQGRGVTQSVTGELIRYDNCGANVKLIERIPDVHRRQKIAKIFKKLPQIVDFAGLGNVNSLELSEILELLIGGYLPSGTCMKALENCQKDFGVGALKRIFAEPKPDWKVSKIIFMQSCTDEFPYELIECLKGVLNTSRLPKFHLEYKPDIFLLTSKFDLVKDPSLHSIHTSSEAVLTLAEYEKIEETLADRLSISGKSFPWISFTDSISVHSNYVENIALKFLKCLLQPGIPRQQPPDNELGLLKRLELRAFQMAGKVQWFLPQEIRRKPILVAILCMFAVMLAFLIFKSQI